ncbi:MAG: YebC/PmpR family DNA-binding transcriptional regulator, partial [Firmicutes bacterium]|nr:YebC/PmpR family DNA-binding transcriptional regulator [Bacillota bacterium]
VRQILEKACLTAASADVSLLPTTTVELTGEDAQKMLRLIDMLEDHDDVSNVYTNADISDEEVERYNG